MIVVCPTPSSPVWKDLLLAAPAVITALTALAGVVVAKAGLDTWRRETVGKRKIELAEAVLADFYEARDILEAARSPGGFEDEGASRRRSPDETEEDTRKLDSYFRTIERLNSKSEFFALLHSRRYRFQAIFGRSAATSFDELFRIRNEIIVAGRMLMMFERNGDIGSLPQDRKSWLSTLGWSPDNDPIKPRLDQAVEAVEQICTPALTGASASV